MDTMLFWITLIVLGGLMGLIGQLIRVAIGVKKIFQQAKDEARSFSDLFQTSTLVVSLLFGAAAGALASFLSVGTETSKVLNEGSFEEVRNLLLGFLAAGYAGTDFIEGVIKRRMPK